MNQNLLRNCILTGLLTIGIGLFTERTLTKYDRKDNFLSRLKKNYFLFILILFSVGCLIHYFFDYIGLEASCERKCANDVCEYKCHISYKI